MPNIACMPAIIVPVRVDPSVLPEAFGPPERSTHEVPFQPTKRRSAGNTPVPLTSGIDTVMVSPTPEPDTGIQSHCPSWLTDDIGLVTTDVRCVAFPLDGSPVTSGVPAIQATL